jgi:hypothetical protein
LFQGEEKEREKERGLGVFLWREKKPPLVGEG